MLNYGTKMNNQHYRKESSEKRLGITPTNVRSKMSLVVNDYWYKCTISGVGSSSLKFTLVTYSKIFVIQPDHRA